MKGPTMISKLRDLKDTVSEYKLEIAAGATAVAIFGALVAWAPEVFDAPIQAEEPEEKIVIEVHHHYHS